MVTIGKRWRLRTLMVLIALAAFGLAYFRKLPDLGPVFRLKYADPQGRMSAAVELGERFLKKGNSAEPALVAALSDQNQDVCDCAAWALDQFGSTDPALVKALAKQVEVETPQSLRWRSLLDFYRRVDPCKALERIKPTASTLAPLLAKAMSNPDPWIRLRAAKLIHEAILWSGGPTPNVSPLLLKALRDEDSKVRLIFINDLVKFDEETRRAAAAILLQRLQRPDPPDVLEATVALAPLGRDAEPAAKILADRLQKGDLADRRGTLFLLGKLGPAAKPAVPAILRAMTANDSGTKNPDFLNRFWRSSPSFSPDDQHVTLGPEDRIHARESLREHAIRVLCGIDRESELQGIGVFNEMSGAGKIEARRMALESLAMFGKKASSAIPTLIRLAEGTEAVPFGSEDANLAFQIFETIHQVGNGDDRRLVEVLVRMLKSKGGVQRAGAVLALGNLSPPPKGVVPALVAAMKDEQPIARRAASNALGRYLGSERKAALKALLAAMNDPDPWVRIAAGRSLAGQGEAAALAVPAIIRLMRTEDPNLRGQAAEIMGKFGPSAKAASAALLAALYDVEGHVRKSAENALNAVSPIECETADLALEALRQGDISQRVAAVCDLVRPGSTAGQEIHLTTQVERFGWRSAILPRRCARRPPQRWGGWVAWRRRPPRRSSPS